VRDLLLAQARRGRTVLVSSHLLSEGAQSVDDVVVIAGGILRAGVSPEVVGAVAAEHRIALVELGAMSRSLEDAFLELTRGAA
jgi:ABC-2 type transport system ATP-binding protein